VYKNIIKKNDMLPFITTDIICQYFSWVKLVAMEHGDGEICVITIPQPTRPQSL